MFKIRPLSSFCNLCVYVSGSQMLGSSVPQFHGICNKLLLGSFVLQLCYCSRAFTALLKVSKQQALISS